MKLLNKNLKFELFKSFKICKKKIILLYGLKTVWIESKIKTLQMFQNLQN